MKIEFDSKPVYGDNDKYIKTKIKLYPGSMITNFQSKKMLKEKAPWKFINNDARSCYQSKEKILFSDTFGRMQI